MYCCFILEAEIMGLCVISLFLLGCSLTGCDIISSIVKGLPQLPGMLKRGNTYLPRDSKGFCLFLWLLLLQPSAGSLTIQADGEVENHTTSPRLEGFLLMCIFKEVPGNHESQFARTSFHFFVCPCYFKSLLGHSSAVPVLLVLSSLAQERWLIVTGMDWKQRPCIIPPLDLQQHLAWYWTLKVVTDWLI